ncbi:hypothetical protein P4909_25115 [Escherichia coli]
MLAAEFTGGYPSFGFAENTDDLFVGKTLLHGDVLMWLMKTLLTSGCTNQRGAGQIHCTIFSPTASASLRMLPEQHAAEARYPIPVEDFHFSIFTAVNNQTVMTSSAEIVLVIEGTATLSHASGESLCFTSGCQHLSQPPSGDGC